MLAALAVGSTLLPLGAADAARGMPRSFAAAADTDAALVLVGEPNQAQEAAAWRLVDGGLSGVDIGADSIGPGTSLVLLTVSALDGPTPATRQALRSLDVPGVPRLAVVVTDTERQTDPELFELLVMEITELLSEAGIDGSIVPVLRADDPRFAASVGDLLDEPPREYAITPGVIVLVGHPNPGQEVAAARLEEGGLEGVTIGAGSVGEATELLLVTVSALDGPMPGTRRAIEALEGSTIRRVGIVLTDTAALDDPELLELVTLETIELLARYGVAGPRVAELHADDDGFVDDVMALLDRRVANHVVTAPSVPPVEAATVAVELVRGVPYPAAAAILAEDGLAVLTVVDPTAGVVSDCYPQVLDQYPDFATDVPVGTTILLTVPQPDPVMFGSECRVAELSGEDELDRYIDEILAQPGLAGG